MNSSNSPKETVPEAHLSPLYTSQSADSSVNQLLKPLPLYTIEDAQPVVNHPLKQPPQHPDERGSCSRKRRTGIISDGESVCNKKLCLENALCRCLPMDTSNNNQINSTVVASTSANAPLAQLENMVVGIHSKPSSSETVDQSDSSRRNSNSSSSNMICCAHQEHVISGMRFASGSSSSSSSDLSDSHDSDSDMEIIEAQSNNQSTVESVGGEALSDGQMFVRWHNRHVAKAIVDNAINKTIEEMGLGPSPPPGMETHQRRVEDQGVSEAIRQWGLRRQSPYYASHLSPIINRLTEVSENLFSRALYRPVVSSDIPSQELTASALSTTTTSDDLDSVPSSSSTRLIASGFESSQHDTTSDSLFGLSHSNNPTISASAVSVEQTSCRSSSPCDSVIDEADSVNRDEILEQAMTAALSQSGLSYVYEQQTQHL